MTKIVVVGANHAGTAAIKTIQSIDSESQLSIFDRNNNISFLGCGMALWIGQQIHNSDGLFYAKPEEFTELGATVNMETEVIAVDFDDKVITAKKADNSIVTESYDKLILATGATPIIPNISGVELENVQLVKLYQNAKEVIEKLKDNEFKKIVVVGAGYIGVELAEAFARLNRDVTIVDLADSCLSTYYDPEFSLLMNQNLEAHKINLALSQKLISIEGQQKVEKVITDQGEYEADMVILCVGFRPNAPFKHAELEHFANGAYFVNKKQETTIKDVYAIGDCATVYDNSLNDYSYIALATNAVRSGIVAANNALGRDMESIGVQGSNGISIFDLKMLSTGMTLSKAKKLGLDAICSDFEDYQLPEFMETNNHKVKLRIVYERNSRRILGAQMASVHDISLAIHMFSLAIQEQLTIDRLKLLDIFFLPHFNKPYNYFTMAALNAE